MPPLFPDAWEGEVRGDIAGDTRASEGKRRVMEMERNFDKISGHGKEERRSKSSTRHEVRRAKALYNERPIFSATPATITLFPSGSTALLSIHLSHFPGWGSETPGLFWTSLHNLVHMALKKVLPTSEPVNHDQALLVLEESMAQAQVPLQVCRQVCRSAESTKRSDDRRRQETTERVEITLVAESRR